MALQEGQVSEGLHPEFLVPDCDPQGRVSHLLRALVSSCKQSASGWLVGQMRKEEDRWQTSRKDRERVCCALQDL